MVGVTTGYISNLENNRLEPSLTLLRELSEKLGIPPSALIAREMAEPVTLMKRAERPRLKFHNLPCACELLTPLSWHRAEADEIEAVEMTAPPGCAVNLESISSDADVCVYVLSGEITYRYGAGSSTIDSDGSLFIPRGTVNSLENNGAEDAVMIFMTKTLSSVRQTEPSGAKKAGNPPSERGNAQLQLLGERIRGLRKSAGIGVRAFAETVGVTPAYISQIERNLTAPSLRVLRRIANELNVELTLLFASSMPSDVLVTTGAGRAPRTIADSNAHLQLLAPYQTMDDRPPDMSVAIVDLGPRQADSEEGIVHDYDELCIVLEGGVAYQTPEGSYELALGDSLYIRKGIHHIIYNRHDAGAKLLVVLGSVMHRRFR